MPFLLIFILISTFAFAKRSHLTCSRDGLHVIAINGVGISEGREIEEFKGNARELFENLTKDNLDASTKGISFSAHHNSSVNVLYDAFESWKLHIQEENKRRVSQIPKGVMLKIFVNYLTSSFKKMQNLCDEAVVKCDKLHEIFTMAQTKSDLNEIKTVVRYQFHKDRNRKILFLTHSAGAIFADRIRDFIREEYPDQYEYTSHLALARPLSAYHKNSYHLTFKDDELTEMLRMIPTLDVPEANLDKSQSCFDSQNPDDPFINHDFSLCYLGGNLSKNIQDSLLLDEREITPAIDQVKDAMYRVAGMLENNDENCCQKKKGIRVWKNLFHWVQGGVVSDEINVADNILIPATVQLCGKGKVLAEEGSFENVEVYGDLDIDTKKFLLSSSKVKQTSLVRLRGLGDVRIQNSELEGNIEIDTAKVFKVERSKLNNFLFTSGETGYQDNKLEDSQLLGDTYIREALSLYISNVQSTTRINTTGGHVALKFLQNYGQLSFNSSCSEIDGSMALEYARILGSNNLSGSFRVSGNIINLSVFENLTIDASCNGDFAIYSKKDLKKFTGRGTIRGFASHSAASAVFEDNVTLDSLNEFIAVYEGTDVTFKAGTTVIGTHAIDCPVVDGSYGPDDQVCH